jgi:hypothetical protein
MSQDFGISTAQSSDTERQLLIKILNALNATGGSGGSNSGIQGGAANYGGGAPSFTPAAGVLGIAVDTSNSRLWLYYGNAWH